MLQLFILWTYTHSQSEGATNLAPSNLCQSKGNTWQYWGEGALFKWWCPPHLSPTRHRWMLHWEPLWGRHVHQRLWRFQVHMYWWLWARPHDDLWRYDTSWARPELYNRDSLGLIHKRYQGYPRESLPRWNLCWPPQTLTSAPWIHCSVLSAATTLRAPTYAPAQLATHWGRMVPCAKVGTANGQGSLIPHHWSYDLHCVLTSHQIWSWLRTDPDVVSALWFPVLKLNWPQRVEVSSKEAHTADSWTGAWNRHLVLKEKWFLLVGEGVAFCSDCCRLGNW